MRQKYEKLFNKYDGIELFAPADGPLRDPPRSSNVGRIARDMDNWR